MENTLRRPTRTPMPVEPRFWKYTKVGEVDECWEWIGHRDEKGYGCLRVGGRRGRIHKAHRISAAIHLGLDLANSSTLVCHKCDNPSCVNPAHLFLGTWADNTRDAAQKGRMAHGSRHHNSKLTEADVLDIRAALASGASQSAVGRRFGVTQCTVSAIARKVWWKHVL